MIGMGKSVKIYVRKEQYSEVHRVMSMNLLEFYEWLGRAKQRNAVIMPNGMTGMIVITNNRYFVVEVQ